MHFPRIFDIYSRRHKVTDREVKPLTPAFRERVLLLCRDTFPPFKDYMGTVKTSEFWLEIFNRLEYLHAGSDSMSEYHYSADTATIDFLSQCSDEHFLDFIEQIFKLELLWHPIFRGDAFQLVTVVNTFLELDDLPYFLTNFVLPTRPTGSSRPVTIPGSRIPKIEAYPQIIFKENEVLHQAATEPTLLLLTAPHYASANEEFLEALGHYRKGEYRDCVLKCGSSIESVMKIICARKNWRYQQKDTAKKLLDTILLQTALDSFYEQPIMLIATIRNQYSTAHGAGTQQKSVPKHVANYVINATASAILLLVDETNP